MSADHKLPLGAICRIVNMPGVSSKLIGAEVTIIGTDGCDQHVNLPRYEVELRPGFENRWCVPRFFLNEFHLKPLAQKGGSGLKKSHYQPLLTVASDGRIYFDLSDSYFECVDADMARKWNRIKTRTVTIPTASSWTRS